MPVRSLNSSVLRWPNRQDVDRAVRRWAASESRRHPGVRRIGYFGSYARGDWGVGSDLELVAVVAEADEPFQTRAVSCDLDDLPVSADLLVFREDEWQQTQEQGSRFSRTMDREAVWVLEVGTCGT